MLPLKRVVVLVATVITVVVVSSAPNDPAPPTTPYAGSTVDVTLGDYVILGNLTAPAGGVRLQAINQGGIIHNVGIRRGPISGDMRPGKGFTIDLGKVQFVAPAGVGNVLLVRLQRGG